MKSILAFVIVLSGQAAAADLTLNDLPSVLAKLRGCTESRSFLGGATTNCKIPKSDLWAAVDSEGGLTLFRQRSYGDTTYAHGKTVNELLQDFAAQINAERNTGKEMLDVLAPLLPTQ